MIKYLINHDKYIRIFGKKFVNNNKDKVKIFINEIGIDLAEYYKINKSNNKNISIKLIGINNITDFSFMFYGCPALIEISDISLVNNFSKVNNISFMFFGCSSLKSLPDISKWDTSNVLFMKYMFYGFLFIIFT